MANLNLTADTQAFFVEIVEDLGNWSGMPLFGGNISDSAKNKGHLTDLKKKGLVTSFREEGCTWLELTEDGKAFATELGLEDCLI